MTRTFSAGDTVNIWSLLNEIKGWIDDLASRGVTARYWRGGLPADRAIADSRYVSIKPNDRSESSGLSPTWDGDTFKLPAGVYRIEWQVTFDNDGDGSRATFLMLNPTTTVFNQAGFFSGSTLRAARTAPSSTAGNTTVSPSAITRRFSATDRLMVGVFHSAGNSLAIKGADQDTELIITRIGD